MHLVSTFASEAGIVLGQMKTDQKSNEITAIPELLGWLNVRRAIVTIDAMGCQKNLAEKIVHRGGDYLLALKGNQSNLPEDVELYFTLSPASSLAKMSTAETLDKGHGRIEIRRGRLSTDMEWLQLRHPECQSLNSIVAIESERQVGDTISPETRYFISSSLTTASEALAAVRFPWSLDN
ncbi:MAG: ISAs1 family transposase [Thioploca sp.]|nr:ISAs1 family transposase [Thioploca sp.]